jgi:hypothetical protein
MTKSVRRARRGREAWRVLIDEWRASGTTATEFARLRGLSATSLAYWNSKLRDEATTRSAPRLLPVHVASSTAVQGSEFELVVGRLSVRFEEGASPKYVAALARALVDAAS